VAAAPSPAVDSTSSSNPGESMASRAASATRATNSSSRKPSESSTRRARSGRPRGSTSRPGTHPASGPGFPSVVACFANVVTGPVSRGRNRALLPSAIWLMWVGACDTTGGKETPPPKEEDPVGVVDVFDKGPATKQPTQRAFSMGTRILVHGRSNSHSPARTNTFSTYRDR